MRSMELRVGEHTPYSSTFDETTGAIVRIIDIPSPRHGYSSMYDLPHAQDPDFRKKYPHRYHNGVFSPVPETVDISITDKCGFGCSYCLSPETPVLGADLLWRPIASVNPGDLLAGFDEFPEGRQHRKLRPSVVEDVRFTKRDVLRIVTDAREVFTTDNHGWLQHRSKHGHRWQAADELRVGRALSFFAEPFGSKEPTDDYRLGYLAGMTLGDGTFRFEPGWKNWAQGFPQSYWRVALKDEQALGRLVAYLAHFGVESNIRPFDGGPSAKAPMQKVEVRSISKLGIIHGLVSSTCDTPEYQRGFLAGFFDAEGSHDGNLRYSQKDVTPLERVVRYAASFGFNFKIEPPSPASVASNARLVGTVADRMRFLGVVRPAIARKTTDWVATSLEVQPEVIRSIEKVGLREVVDIQTSSATFFAAGLATHNCYQDSKPRRPHGPTNLVETILKGFDKPPYQIAIGGGEPTTHPDFIKILQTAKELGTVPNYTTAGHAMTEGILLATNAVCGGVAMTFHAFKGIDWFVEHYNKLRKRLKVQLNVHLIADKDVAKNLDLLTDKFSEIGSLNLVLLAYYQEVGRSTSEGMMPKRVYMKDLPEAIGRAKSVNTKIAFSEGLFPYFLSRPELGIETRFAMPSEGFFTCYFSPEGKISSSSFSKPWHGEKETAFTTRSQDLWDKLHAWSHHSNGVGCYQCDLTDRCVSPQSTHTLSCAFQPHNLIPLKEVVVTPESRHLRILREDD